MQTLNGNVWKRHIDHVKIDRDDSAAEVAKEKEDCNLASPELFPEETEQTSAPSNASKSVNPVYCLPRHKLSIDRDNADPQIN